MKVLVTWKLTEEELNRIKAAANNADVAYGDKREEWLSHLEDAEIIFGHFDKEMFERAKKLKWVQLVSAGVDAYLFPEFIESDILLTSGKGTVGVPLAEHAFALLLSLTRGISFWAKERRWVHPREVSGWVKELHGGTMGIVGLGSAGREVAKRAAAFGMRVIAVDAEDVPKPDCVEGVWKLDRFHHLLCQSDVVCICAPLTPQTEGMFGIEEFKQMKRSAILINVTRGKIVQEEALLTALREGLIGGAGLDVTPAEPLPDDHPLWSFDNVVITPHVASVSPQTLKRGVDLFCENLRRYQNGEPLLSVIDKRKGY